MVYWDVSDDPPSEKSICCRDFGDGVRSGEGLGTLRRLPKAPISLVSHFEGGSPGGKMAKNGQKVNFFLKSKNPRFFLPAMSMVGWLGSGDVGVQN